MKNVLLWCNAWELPLRENYHWVVSRVITRPVSCSILKNTWIEEWSWKKRGREIRLEDSCKDMGWELYSIGRGLHREGWASRGLGELKSCRARLEKDRLLHVRRKRKAKRTLEVLVQTTVWNQILIYKKSQKAQNRVRPIAN